MEWLAAIIASLVSGLFGFFGSKNQSDTNVQAVKDTNESNYNIAQQTNAANVEQAELAYKRSLPTAQVQQMMQAGMSKYGALSALQGGGSYTAPTLQSAHFDAPQENVDFNALAERLQNIPANAQQASMVREQTSALIQDQRRKDEELRIAIEKHNQEMEFQRNDELRKQYGQNVVVMTDKLRSRVEDLIAKKKADRTSFNTIQDLVNTLDLDNDPYWRNAPASSRDSVFEYVRGLASENRANRAAQDTHDTNVLNRENVRLAIDRGRAEFKQWQSESNARQKEVHLREIAADLNILRSEIGLADDEAKTYLYYVRDIVSGKLKKDEVARDLGKTAQLFDDFWNGLFKIIPLNALSKSILGDLIKIGI